MTPREQQVLAELENIDERYLEVIERMFRALGSSKSSTEPGESWHDFIASTYGCMADAPIEREEQGEPETRDLLR